MIHPFLSSRIFIVVVGLITNKIFRKISSPPVFQFGFRRQSASGFQSILPVTDKQHLLEIEDNSLKAQNQN